VLWIRNLSQPVVHLISLGEGTKAQAWHFCMHLSLGTGGSRGAGGSLLLRLHELLEAEEKLAAHQQRLNEMEQQLKKLEPLGRQYRR